MSLTIDHGDLVAIVGPTASSKSTLLHIIGTLERPIAGTVRIEGIPPPASKIWSSRAAGRAIGCAFQGSFLAEHPTALQDSDSHAALVRAIILPCSAAPASIRVGTIATIVDASTKSWAAVTPAIPRAGRLVAVIAIGAVAGLAPAPPVGRLPASEALCPV